MTFFDMVSFAKLFSRVAGGNMTMSDAEMEAASEVLKKFADRNSNWTPMQRDLYKIMVDAAKENSKR